VVEGITNEEDDDDDEKEENEFDDVMEDDENGEGDDDEKRRQQLREEAIAERFSANELKIIHDMRAQPDLYSKMVQSVAPNIYGHEDIKRGVLLLMFGRGQEKSKHQEKLQQ